MFKTLTAVCLCLIITAGCDRQETAPAKKAAAPGRQTTLLIGLIPEHNIFNQLKRYEPVTVYIAEKLGVNIKLKVLTKYGNIIDNFVSTGLDGAFFGSFTYTLAHVKLGVEVLARPLYIDGTSTYHGLIFVRKDSGIKTVKDMKGKIFAFVDKATTAGYLVPLYYFQRHGIDNYRTYFKETYFTGTHEDAIYDILNQKADIGAAKNTVYQRLSDTDERIIKELVIIESFRDVPANGLAVKKDLDDSIKNRLKEVMLNMHNDPDGINILRNFGVQRFIETKNDDYVNVYEYTKQINLDLATYDYIND